MMRSSHTHSNALTRRNFLRLGAGAAAAAMLGQAAPGMAHSGAGAQQLQPDHDQIITNIRTNARKVCLTFDDMWSEYFTLKICRAYAKRNIRLTLFPIGLAIHNNLTRPNDGFADLYPRLLDMGHEFGSHLFTHRPISAMTLQQLIDEEMEPALNSMRRALGASYRPVGIRPPYGMVTDAVKELALRYGIPLVLWGLDSQDAICTHQKCTDNCEPAGAKESPDYLRYLEEDLPEAVCFQDTCAERCVETIVGNYESYLRPGTIILHHAIKASYLAIPRVVKLLDDWNMEPVPLSSLLTYRSA